MRTLTRAIVILLALYVAIYAACYQITHGFGIFVSAGALAVAGAGLLEK